MTDKEKLELIAEKMKEISSEGTYQEVEIFLEWLEEFLKKEAK